MQLKTKHTSLKILGNIKIKTKTLILIQLGFFSYSGITKYEPSEIALFDIVIISEEFNAKRLSSDFGFTT